MGYIFAFYSYVCRITAWLAILIIPGGGILLTKRYRLAFYIPILGVLWVSIFSGSRMLLTPIGFSLVLIGLLAMQCVCIFLAIKSKKNNKAPTLSFGLMRKFCLLLIVNIAIILSCHLYKDKWFGFAFYHIPSESMNPTLQTGDVVLIDTWIYNKSLPKTNDILIIKRSPTGLVLAKRLKDIRKLVGQTELYIVGDNQNYSIDSRRFGWITDEYLIGKVKLIWFSFLNESRYLTSAK
jgi:signal peptidase I